MISYKRFALSLAKKSAAIMRTNFGLKMKKTMKKDSSPVTKTDLTINTLVIKSVKKNFPSHGVLAEEKSDFSKKQEYIWVCDPVDGTIPFSHGIPVSTFTLALVKNGEPILGIVVDPFQNRYFFAEKNKGAYLNNKRIWVSSRKTLKASMVFVEYWKQAPYDSLHILEALENKNCHAPVMKSIAYGGGLVAAGEAVGLIFPGKSPWDIAAAKIIVEEAGGKVTDLYGNKQRYDKDTKGCIASNGFIHNELIKITKSNV